MNHSKGPWKIVDNPTETTQIHGPNSLRICDVWCTDLPHGMENACLIAAAPELLAALKEILVHSEDCYVDAPKERGGSKPSIATQFKWISDTARTAIARAEGRG